MRRLFLITLLLIATTAIADTQVVVSDLYTINRKYRSMEGPSSTRSVYLGDPGEPELLWLIGVKTEMVGADGKTPQLPEFMCHVNVDYDAPRHQSLFNISRGVSARVVTLSQGVLSVRVPDGFGFPIASNEPLQLFTQVLNHNIEKPNNIQVRHRVTFEYVRDRDLKTPMKPLFNVGASGMVLLNENSQAAPSPVDLGGAHGATCLMAPRAPNARASSGDYIDPKGRKFTGHWVVPPGRQVNHSDITWFMDLPFDAKLHYAAIHLHPFAESLTLRDVTTDTTIFSARAQNPATGIGLTKVDAFSSPRGVPLYKSHQYELVSVYNNPTGNMHDSMASVFLGIEDPSFRKPRPGDLTARSDDGRTPDTALLETSWGGIGLKLLPQGAPGATRQFSRLVRTGAIAGARITRIAQDAEGVTIYFSAKTTPERARVFKDLTPERPANAGRVTLAVCGASGDSVTFAISMGKPSAGSCSVFGQIPAGAQSLAKIAAAKVKDDGRPVDPIAITNAAVYEDGVKLPPL